MCLPSSLTPPDVSKIMAANNQGVPTNAASLHTVVPPLQSSTTDTKQFLFALDFGNYSTKWSGSTSNWVRTTNTFHDAGVSEGGTYRSLDAETWDKDHDFSVTNGNYYRIHTDNFSNNFLNDSKLLSEKNRFVLRPTIIEEAISYSVTHIEPLIIDEINILNASLKAMQESILKFNQKKSHAMRGSLNKNYRKNYFPLFFLACAIVAAMLFAFLPEAIT